MVPVFPGANTGTYLWAGLDETFRHDPANCFAHRSAADTQFFTKPHSRWKRLTGLEFSAQYRQAKVINEPVVHSESSRVQCCNVRHNRFLIRIMILALQFLEELDLEGNRGAPGVGTLHKKARISHGRANSCHGVYNTIILACD
jgi:hypothetical protein